MEQFKNCSSAEFLLIEGLEQGALQKELLIVPFVEHFKTATLGECYWEILSVLRMLYLNIPFLPSFCWWKLMYRVPCLFSRAIYNIYFRKVSVMTFINASNKNDKVLHFYQTFSDRKFITRCSNKGAVHYSFHRVLYTNTLGNFYWEILPVFGTS